jgi:hypothetical protein
LNPVRAGIATDLPSSDHTSIRRRLQDRTTTQGMQPLEAAAGIRVAGVLPLTLDQYLDLVDWTGRELHPGKRGVIAASAPRPLSSFTTEREWLMQVRGIESRYWRAVGSATALLEKAKALGQCWLKRRGIAPAA